MARTQIKINEKELKEVRDLIKRVRTPIDRLTASDVGKEVVKEMRDQISKGISPIRGARKFPSYKNPAKYPGKRKNRKPVNLKLTGDFLRGLSYGVFEEAGNYETEIFYKGDEDLKEEGHREGVFGQPKRPTIPSEAGERFNKKIEDEITKIYAKRIEKLIKRG